MLAINLSRNNVSWVTSYPPYVTTSFHGESREGIPAPAPHPRRIKKEDTVRYSSGTSVRNPSA